MAQRPHRSMRRKRVRGLLILSTGVALVLLSCLLGFFMQANQTSETQAARPTPVSHPDSTRPATITHATSAAVPTRAATPANIKLIPVHVRAYTIEGMMADGKATHVGACAVSPDQFPLGTVLYLYNKDDHTFNRQCTAEDTGGDIEDGEVDIALPGDSEEATKWGQKDLLARVVRRGWDDNNAPTTLPTP